MTYSILLTIQAQGPYGKLQNKFFPQRYDPRVRWVGHTSKWKKEVL